MTVLCETTVPNSSSQNVADSLGSFLALECAVERADELLVGGDLRDALIAWDRVARISRRVFGANDATVVDAERISAAILFRMERADEAKIRLRSVWNRLEQADGDPILRRSIECDLEEMVRVSESPAPAEC